MGSLGPSCHTCSRTSARPSPVLTVRSVQVTAVILRSRLTPGRTLGTHTSLGSPLGTPFHRAHHSHHHGARGYEAGRKRRRLCSPCTPPVVPLVSSWTLVTVSPMVSPSTRVTLSPTPSSVWTWLAVS